MFLRTDPNARPRWSAVALSAALFAGPVLVVVGLVVAAGMAGGTLPAEARSDVPLQGEPAVARLLDGSDVLKKPNAANLFVGAGPLEIEEVVTSVPPQGLGAFDLQVTYDPNVLLVYIKEGSFLGSTNRLTKCTTTWKPGALHFSCTSAGKNAGPSGTGVLAVLNVHPSPDLKLRATKSNGIKVELNDVFAKTKLFYTSGKKITVRKVGDAKIIVRLLTGDVNGDCVVDLKDRDLVLARLGARKGSLKYIQNYDLQPPQKPDGDIDIQDLQVVSGRVGSTCDSPHAGQESPTPRPTKTPKMTPTPTPTVIGPPFKKLPPLVNLFLTAQGDKIPPDTCVGSTDFVELIETLDGPVLTPGQEIGGFSFQVNYDPLKVCVELRRGPAADQNMECEIEDSITAPALQGIAHMRCVPKSKDVTGPNTKEEEGRQIAIIVIRPQPDLYSKLIAGKQNGIVVQLLNKGCKLFDLQGFVIPPVSCDDADVTIRFLEADIAADCIVDGFDTQLASFHFGTQKGSLLYLERLDISPPGGDGEIDINDLQFIYGRFGSTCEIPHPSQPPSNPKAVP